MNRYPESSWRKTGSCPEKTGLREVVPWKHSLHNQGKAIILCKEKEDSIATKALKGLGMCYVCMYVYVYFSERQLAEQVL